VANELITSGAGAVIPAADAGGAVGEYAGDISRESSAVAPGAEATRAPVEASIVTAAAEVASYMRRVFEPTLVRLGLSEQQRNGIERAMRSMFEDRGVADKEDAAESREILREKWGADAHPGNIQTVIEFLIDICGSKEVADRVIYAREQNGRGVTCDVDLIEGLLAYARKVKELERDLLIARALQGSGNPAPGEHIEKRITEIEGWMGTDRYIRDEAVQEELRELYRRRRATQRETVT
jgi:hypothetical protein